jgi:hypothetical protein
MNTTNKIVIALAVITLLFVIMMASDDKSNVKSEDSTSTSIYGTGRITSIADGVELGKVNLWTSTSSNRSVECTVIKGQKVRITEDADPYYYVEAIGRSDCEGYCMKEFVIRD